MSRIWDVSDITNHLYGDSMKLCAQCGVDTYWTSLTFEVPLHPGACTTLMWERFADAATDLELGRCLPKRKFPS